MQALPRVSHERHDRLWHSVDAHLAGEELYIPILEDTLTPPEEASLARALDHVASERL